MTTNHIPDRLYKILFIFLGAVYAFGLFVPLMDNDSAHHANIALHMHLTGDYVSLVDYNGAYLDKPHLSFWLAAFSYKIFGVTGFAYKLPSFLFTLFGVYSTYRLGKSLYNKEAGKLAALILASSFAFILANNDVRMDAILTACIAFSTWQLVDFIHSKKWISVAGAALGLALGFSTKGDIAVFVPAAGAFYYILYRREWSLFYNPKWLLLILLFAAGITPVLYSYYQQFNCHPDVSVRGKDHINGVRFILFNQSVERFRGDMGQAARRDYFFFLHSFLWAFAPWCLLAYHAVFLRLKNIFKRKSEWLTAGSFITMVLIVTFSGFKLPHYLNIVFPAASVFTSVYLLTYGGTWRWIKGWQLFVSIFVLLTTSILNFWAFPVKNLWVYIGLILCLSLFIYCMRSSFLDRFQKTVSMTVAAMICGFFLLNANFYPRLLTYQGGNMLAIMSRGKADPKMVYYWKNTYSSSFGFYTSTLRKPFGDSVLLSGKKSWLLFDSRDENDITHSGYKLGVRFVTPDYEITNLDLPFINPDKRERRLAEMVLAEITK